MAKKRASKAKPATPATLYGASQEWADLLRSLPGYDPFRDAEGCWFDPELAQRAIDFIEECCRHIEGDLAGQPFILQPWQKSYVANLFGWQRKDSQGRTVRRYRKSLLYVPRKSGKTPLVAAISLYVFFCDPEAGQQNYIAAADREQAGLLFRQARGMVEQESELVRRCKIFGGSAPGGQSRSIVKPDASFLKVISADANSKHGGTPHLVIVDELHAQPDRELVDVLSTSMASHNRKQPLFLLVTTADFDRPSICNEEHKYACSVRDGVIADATYLPAVYETLPDEDWTKEEVWRKCNPNLGVSVSLDYFRAEVKKAQENPEYEYTFRRLHTNCKTTQAHKAIDLLQWDELPSYDLAELEGKECWGGLDLSTVLDLTAFALAFDLGDRIALLLRFWCPEDGAAKRSKRDRVPYLAWAERGFVKLTPGAVVDYDIVRKDINELGERYFIKDIGADRWNSTQLLTQLAGDGLNVVAFGQGFLSMTCPTKDLLARVAAGTLCHNGNPVLRWMAGNLFIEVDAAENKKPSKKKSTERIDGFTAAIMALGRYLNAPLASTYETQGIEGI